MAMHGTVDTLLDRVKAIAPMLRAYAAEAEAQRRLARPVIEAMRQAGLYSMAHPQAFGGLEVDPSPCSGSWKRSCTRTVPRGGICKCPLAPAVS
jgi:alkylation response protein AidB-like acyl-CoA dehydrogenase